jgi:Spy/CpxP family protein refolding chaperone
MNWNQFAMRVVVVAQLFSLSAIPRLALAQVGRPALMPTSPMAAPAVLTTRDTRATDADFAGLNFTDDQKAKIDEVHRHMALRKDAAIKSDSLNVNQKEAMIAGLSRMERGEIVKLLTPEQQRAVLKKVRAGHPATQGEDAKSSLPQ